jgi:hypothetical protein
VPKRIIGNLGNMVQAVHDQGENAVLFNVPNANEAMSLPYVVNVLGEKPSCAIIFAPFVGKMFTLQPRANVGQQDALFPAELSQPRVVVIPVQCAGPDAQGMAGVARMNYFRRFRSL